MEKGKQREDLDQLFIVTYWRNLGFDDVNFSGGKPAMLALILIHVSALC
jgi:hypothetical protein